VRTVNAVHGLSDDAWCALDSLVTRRTYRAREHLAPLGSLQRSVGLLEHGHVRAYVTTADGKHYNKHLFVAPTFVGDYASLLTGQPVVVPQQALTPCVVWWIDRDALGDLEARHPSIAMLQRRFAEALYLAKERREIEIATLDASARYDALVHAHPELDQAIPLYEIAAYLGITPTQLSRIRRRKR
jgi:CRP-like cAMP-binding protein